MPIVLLEWLPEAAILRIGDFQIAIGSCMRGIYTLPQDGGLVPQLLEKGKR